MILQEIKLRVIYLLERTFLTVLPNNYLRWCNFRFINLKLFLVIASYPTLCDIFQKQKRFFFFFDTPLIR